MVSDEARVGEQGTLIWSNACVLRAHKGTRPRAPKDWRTAWARIFGAGLAGGRATGAALVMPCVNAEAMNLHLAEIARTTSPSLSSTDATPEPA